MLRFSLISASALLLYASASAQMETDARPARTVKNAGIYHVAAGTWTRNTMFTPMSWRCAPYFVSSVGVVGLFHPDRPFLTELTGPWYQLPLPEYT